MTWMPTVSNCDNYLSERSGRYDWRAVRYRAAADAMMANGLSDSDTVFDIGAGMTEFDFCLRAEYGWKGRYIPIDGSIDGTDINTWIPPRHAEWFVGLEILEHLDDYFRKAIEWRFAATKGVIFSTPNPATTDVLGMDPTHVSEVDKALMEAVGFVVTEETFYGGVFSKGLPDSLLGVWLND